MAGYNSGIQGGRKRFNGIGWKEIGRQFQISETLAHHCFIMLMQRKAGKLSMAQQREILQFAWQQWRSDIQKGELMNLIINEYGKIIPNISLHKECIRNKIDKVYLENRPFDARYFLKFNVYSEVDSK